MESAKCVMKATILLLKNCANNYPLIVLLPVLQANALNATKVLLFLTEIALKKLDKIRIVPDKTKTENVLPAETFLNLSMEIVSLPDKILSVNLAHVNVERESVWNAKRDFS